MDMFAGPDLGKKRDYTAIAVLLLTTERRERLPGSTLPRRAGLHAAATGPGSSEIVCRRCVQRHNTDAAAADAGAKLAVDEIGVGTAVTDRLRIRDLNPYAVTITGGDTVSRKGRDMQIPKRELVTAVNVLLETRRLRIPG